MLFSFFIVCAVALGLSTVLLVAVGRHIHHDSLLGGLLAAVVYFIAGWIAAQVWSLPAGPVEAAEVFCLAVGLIVIALRPVWNPDGELFMGSFVAAALAYLIFAAAITVGGNLSIVRRPAGAGS